MEQEHEKRAAALAGLLCAALTLAFVPASGADEPPQPNAPAVQAAEAPANRQDDGKRFVLTRSGEIVEGRLRDGGSAYLLEFDKGGSTLVSKLDALFIGGSRKDVFQLQPSFPFSQICFGGRICSLSMSVYQTVFLTRNASPSHFILTFCEQNLSAFYFFCHIYHNA